MSANPSRTGLKFFVTLVVLAAAGVAGWLSFRPVAKVAAVRPGAASKIVPGTVVVTPEKTLEIRSEADGRLLESELAPGKKVKEGDKLAQIDATDIDIQIKHNESELAALRKTIEINDAKAQLAWKTTEEEFKETERLYQTQSLAEVPFTKAKRTFEVQKEEIKLTKIANERQIESLENTLETLRLQRKRTTVLAPFEGEVSLVYFHPGALIEKKQTLATLITANRLVIGKISEENFAEIQLGQTGLVKFLGYGDETFSAKVIKKLPTAEEATQRYLIYLDVTIAPERLLANLSGDVAITISERKAQTLVPRRAVFDGKFVYVVEGGRVMKRELEIGFTSLTAIEVLKGLREGEQVIADELDKFAPGDRVRVEPVKW
ncbi:MAG: efflux RND transporter periplasmic adaptor subunit [Verrucomicrobia bacterium]|nr:efflux RND transporter periplasmic adaptor subunit [Verrucomicrobiota bacterium]